MTNPTEIEARVAVLERALVSLMRVVQESDPLMGPLMISNLKGLVTQGGYCRWPKAEVAACRALIERAVEAKVG